MLLAIQWAATNRGDPITGHETRVHEPLHNRMKMAIETMKVLLTTFHATSNLIDRKSSLSFWSYHYILMRQGPSQLMPRSLVQRYNSKVIQGRSVNLIWMTIFIPEQTVNDSPSYNHYTCCILHVNKKKKKMVFLASDCITF